MLADPAALMEKRMSVAKRGSDDVACAVDCLRRGELVAFPTETVYGLGAHARNPDAVARVFKAKGRPADRPLIVHLADREQLHRWGRDLSQEALALAESFWPGPLTLVVRKQAWVDPGITSGQDSVAVRVPAHPLALRLLGALGDGIVAPSANRFGRISPTLAQHVRHSFGSELSCLLDGGPCTIGLESTIVSCLGTAPSILRPGAIDATALSRVLDRPIAPWHVDAANAHVRVPGQCDSHYAPRIPAVRIDSGHLDAALDMLAEEAVGVLARCSPPSTLPPTHRWLCMPADATTYGRLLYRALHDFDQPGLDLILVEAPPEDEPWAAVHDRLRRATTLWNGQPAHRASQHLRDSR